MEEELNLLELLDRVDSNVTIKKVINTKTMKEYEIHSCYTDIFMIINMLYDYVKLIHDDGNFKNKYYKEKFLNIADSLAEQIGYDYEATMKKLAKKEQKDDIGEDGLTLLMNR